MGVGVGVGGRCVGVGVGVGGRCVGVGGRCVGVGGVGGCEMTAGVHVLW